MMPFWRFISYLFHPLFAPLAGVVAYYLVSPEYAPPEMQRAVVLSTLILTIGIPVIFFFLFRHIGWIHSVYLHETSERKLPLYIFILLIFIMARNIIFPTLAFSLYYYFIGVLGTLIAALVLVYFKMKASMHMMGISGLTVFILGLSVHYEINITLALAGLVMSMGLVASARLYMGAHNSSELWTGFFVGIVPQFITFNYWL